MSIPAQAIGDWAKFSLVVLCISGCANGPASTGSNGGDASGGQRSTGGSLGAGGASGSGGVSATGGSAIPAAGGSSSATGGNVVASGGATGGSAGSSSVGSSGGVAGSAAGGNGGRSGGAAGANNGGAGGASTGTSTGACGPTTHNQFPFGCKFAWGAAANGGSLASFSYLQFASFWIESNIAANGTMTVCNGCNWIKSSIASTNLIPAYYAYIIGFLAHANGIVDGNQSGSKKLTTDGAALVKANYDAIVNAYAWYAKKTAEVWPSKPLIWLLEGDFVQLVDAGQSSPMTYAQVGKLAADITCAIRSNMPNAVVAIDHSSWNSDDVTNNYWGAMASANYDMVWTTGVGNNNGFIADGTTSSTYNGKTATYAYLHKLTGRTILVDTSAGASAAGDSWTTAGLANINARIADGVIAANITGSTAPNQSNISGLSGVNALPDCQ